MITIVGVALSLAMIALAVGYNSGMFLLSRRRYRAHNGQTRNPRFYVFLVACLNEEAVIRSSLDRLSGLPGKTLTVVVDDASDDRTAELVRAAGDAVLYRRTPPDARHGKGAALNAGLAHLRASGLLDGHDPADVVVCVVDADGRLDPHAVQAVDPYFDDPRIGAVQIGVRMYNRDRGVLARLQDMEFVVYGEIFQNARRHLGSVGMGGNGQFMRLSALDSLNEDPWSDCLTEDLDLGVRLIAAGWTNAFCGAAAVSQQAVLTPGRLVRQRSRWFQGHMQAARKLYPLILRTIDGRAAADLLYHLSSPALLLLTSLLPVSFAVAFADAVWRGALSPLWFVWFYTITFGLASVYAYVYRKREKEVGRLRVLLLGHAYVLYGYLWFLAGWWALWRALSGKQGWLKTART
ncbi:glycosyltransferase [Actinocorallia sp. API 0066]|uniref:glycosyltransferase family 2 protein n=1 Tax=Actinocorallia sp. API 0066 TaxID=2896846 RepID=UPI001E34BB9A|nr:glycosyltransferase family 2 protein [Actinocorallia sp. API 0066]MCD0453302.1 glycosyltransferase [Actinocorallia sp. API 0066]